MSADPRVRLVRRGATWCLAAGALAAIAMAGGPGDPLPPSGPIGILIQVGTVASTDDKVEVSLVGLVMSEDQRLTVQLADKSMLGGKTSVPATELVLLGAALSEASEAAMRRRPFSSTVGGTTITATSPADIALVTMKCKQEQFSFSSDTITFDADNAASLARILERADRIVAWLRPRLKALDPQSELPLTITGQDGSTGRGSTRP